MTRPDFALAFPRAGVLGGVERVALDLLRYQSSRRNTCFVGETLDGADVRHEFVRVGRVPPALHPVAFRRASAKVLARINPRTTLSFGVNCPPGDVYWVQSVHRAWLEDGGDVRYKGIRVPSAVRRLLLRHQVLLRLEHDYFVNGRPRAILCTSQREADDIARLYGVDPSITHVMPNGYDGSVFSVDRRAQDRSRARAELGAGDDDIVVLVVANEWHRKGLGPLLEAIGAVGDRRIRLDLVGKRSPEDYLPLAHRLGLDDRMRWHGASSDVARFHAAADVFALPTTYEPFGLVIVEAMASGLPVITSRLAGASPAIRHGSNGLLLDDPRNPEEIAAALRSLLDSTERERMGHEAGTTVDDYEWQRVFARADRVLFPDEN